MSKSSLSKTTPPNLRKLASLVEDVRHYALASRSINTVNAYKRDFEAFDDWCRREGLDSLPCSPETLGLYLAAVAKEGKATATIKRYLASIAEVHKAKGFPSPVTDQIKLLEKGIRRTIGTAQKQARPLLPAELKAMVEQIPDTMQGNRDRAMLLLGFAGAFRRSELVALNVGDVKTVREGLEITVRKSKTDQEGQGRKVAIPFGSHHDTCPVRAVTDWLHLLEDATNKSPLFRPVKHGTILEGRASDKAVDRLVKRLAQKAGLEAVSAHSLRAGLATAAYLSGKSDRAIMNQGRWTSTASVNRYIRDGKLWKDDNAAGGIGL